MLLMGERIAHDNQQRIPRGKFLCSEIVSATRKQKSYRLSIIKFILGFAVVFFRNSDSMQSLIFVSGICLFPVRNSPGKMVLATEVWGSVVGLDLWMQHNMILVEDILESGQWKSENLGGRRTCDFRGDS